MKRKKLTYEDIKTACDQLELIGLENRTAVKKKYLQLSKKYHPDMPNGDNEKFQKLNDAYKILEQYMEEFTFQFTADEFYDQYPHALSTDAEWFKRKH